MSDAPYLTLRQSNFLSLISSWLLIISEARFDVDDYFVPCYLYECVAPLRALLLQKTAPGKFKKVDLETVGMTLNCTTLRHSIKRGMGPFASREIGIVSFFERKSQSHPISGEEITLISTWSSKIIFLWLTYSILQLMSLESHLDIRRNHPSWDKTQANVVDVMKKTLGKLCNRQWHAAFPRWSHETF